MIISRTPFRISFFGGGTDFPAFFESHGGAVLLTTIDKYCYISVHRLSPFFKYRFRASYARTELVSHASEFQHPLIRECLLYMGIETGLEITHVSDLPGRTGLGTSSSFTVGLLHALHAFKGHSVTAEDLATQAIEVERKRVGDPGGLQDQYAAAYGGLLKLAFAAGPAVEVEPLPLTSERLRLLKEHLLLFYTGEERSAGAITSEQQARVAQNAPALREMRDMVERAERILRGGGALLEFGDLLRESWARKKSLSRGISNPLIDQAYDAARSAGARGGKLLGAGGHGFLLLFADPSRAASIRERLCELQEVNFRFSEEGSRIIFRTADG